MDDTSAMRGYSSECEVWWADAADEMQDESMERKSFAALWHRSDDTSPVSVQQTDADSNILTQHLLT